MPILNGHHEFFKLNLQLFAEPAGGEDGAGGDPAPAGDDKISTGGVFGTGSTSSEGEKGDQSGVDAKSLAAQIEQLKADMAKQKAALDAATSEAGKYKKELRAKQTQEEIDAANKKEAEEKAAKELEELRREVARAKSTKSVMAKLSVDEDAAGKIAECLSGCEDVENALLLIQKAWDAKEKALRLEFGKIPGPGTGGSSEEDAEEKAALELARRLGKERATANQSVTDGLKGYIR